MERDIILQFSGGKDSLAVMHVCRPLMDRITVAFCDSGAVFPHVGRFVQQVCEDFNVPLEIVRPDEPIRNYLARRGVPADLVPAHNLAEAAFLTDGTRELINPVIQCCADMIWLPMQRYVFAKRPKFVIRGSKGTDGRTGAPDGYIENGITFLSPLWDMTDDQVFAYLQGVGAKLPEHYAHVKSSLDCYFCSAHLTYDPGRERIAYTREHHPDLWPELEANLETMKRVVTAEAMAVHEATRDIELRTGGVMKQGNQHPEGVAHG